jgi:hypothetical protein
MVLVICSECHADPELRDSCWKCGPLPGLAPASAADLLDGIPAVVVHRDKESPSKFCAISQVNLN